MIRGVAYVGGVAVAKLLLIVLGAVVSRNLGGEVYGEYVLFLTLSNAITNFSLMGAVPRILSFSDENEENSIVDLLFASIFLFFIIIFVFLLVYYLTDFISGAFGGADYQVLACVIFYSFGFLLISLMAAFRNRGGQYHLAGYLWFFTSIFAFLVAMSFVFFGAGDKAFVIFSGAWFVSGIVAILFYFLEERKNNFALFFSNKVRPFSCVLRVMYSGLFGLPFLMVFFWLGASLSSHGSVDVHGRSAFFLGFQLFAIAIFLPGVLGSILVPKLSKESGSGKHRLIKRVSFIYLFVGCGWMLVVWLLLPKLFELYGVNYSLHGVFVVLLWQAAGAVAALGAVQNQLLVSQGRYIFLLVGGLVWATLAVSIPFFFAEEVSGRVVGVLVAYLVLHVLYLIGARGVNGN